MESMCRHRVSNGIPRWGNSDHWNVCQQLEHINGDPKIQTREERAVGNRTAETITNLHGINDTLGEDNADLNEAAAKQQAAFVMVVRFLRRKKEEKEANIAEQAAIIDQMEVEASAHEVKLNQTLQVHNISVLKPTGFVSPCGQHSFVES
jgi:hypothetical protein